MKIIAAFDLSSNTGFAVVGYLGEKREVLGHGLMQYSLKEELEERLIRFQRDMRAFLVENQPTAVVYEAAHMRGGGSTRSALGMETVLRMECWVRHIPAVPVHSRSLKKFATGKGDSGKDGMIEAAERMTGIATRNDNVADALCLAEWGRVNVDDNGCVVEKETSESTKKKSKTKNGGK